MGVGRMLVEHYEGSYVCNERTISAWGEKRQQYPGCQVAAGHRAGQRVVGGACTAWWAHVVVPPPKHHRLVVAWEPEVRRFSLREWRVCEEYGAVSMVTHAWSSKVM